MKKQIGTLVIGVLMLTGAMAMYAGENMTFPINITDPVYTVVGNSSNLEGLNVSYENGNITITTVKNFKPDNFTLIFFDNKTKEIIPEGYVKRGSSSGGGSSTTKYIDRDVKVYVPEYVDRNITTEVEVEKIIDRIKYQEEPTNYYYLLFAIALGGILMWVGSKFFGEEEYGEEEYE